MSEETTETEETTEDQTGRIPDETSEADRVSDATSEEAEETTEEETFPRDYVEKLRDENAKYRQRAQRSDELAHRLHRALVAADGRLADPTDLEFDDEHLEDADTLSEAIDGLLETKPHLAARKPAGDIGQGAAGPNAGTVDLAGLLRAGAN